MKKFADRQPALLQCVFTASVSLHSCEKFATVSAVRSRAVARALIRGGGGSEFHIFMLRLSNFFLNQVDSKGIYIYHMSIKIYSWIWMCVKIVPN